MENTLDICRELYNHLLGDLKGQEKPLKRKYEMQKDLTQLKSEWGELGNIHSRVIHMVLYRLYNNLDSVTQNFEEYYNVERLRYKGDGWYKTFTYHQSGFELQDENQWVDNLYLSKIGNIPIRYHRDLPDSAEIKQIKIKKESDGNWFAILGIEVDESVPDTPSADERVVTIGAGVSTYSVDTSGMSTKEPEYDELERKRARVKGNLDRKQNGSNNYNEERKRLGAIDKKIDRKQKDFLHKLSEYYVQSYDVVIVESRYLGRRNSSWWEFLNMLEYKAESASTLLVQVDPDKSATKTCSACETESSEQYWLREKGCPSCGTQKERNPDDLKRITESNSDELGLGKTEVKPVDMIATVNDLESFAGGMAEAGSSQSENLPLP